jgi:hypothetical protein
MPDSSGDALDPVDSALHDWQSAHAMWGPRHESTLTALLTLAEARWSAGDATGALRDAGELLDARREVLGAEHPDTLVVAGMEGRWRYLVGDVGAIERLRQLAPVMVRLLGEEHPDTLLVLHVLAVVEYSDEDPASRLVRWVRLCGAETRAFGVGNETMLAAAFMVAQARYDLGDTYGASSDALVVANYRRRRLGEHHPDTLAAQLARLTWLGEASGVSSYELDGIGALITVAENALGHDHDTALRARLILAAWVPKTAANEVDWISEWESLSEDLARALGEQHQLAVTAREQRAQARAEWEESLNATHEIAFDLYVDAESEDRDIELAPERDWMDPGNLDDEALEKVADDADEQRSERADLMENVVAAKKALSQSARTRGNDDYETLRWRYYLAWRFWYGHEFESAGHRTRRLIDDCVRLLGENDALTVASRKLLSYIDDRTWTGLPPFWDGSASLPGTS